MRGKAPGSHDPPQKHDSVSGQALCGGRASTSSALFEGTFPCQGKAFGTVGFPLGGSCPPQGD